MTNDPKPTRFPAISLWPIVLIIGFASEYLPTIPIVGYRWTVEFAIAGVLLIALISSLTARHVKPNTAISKRHEFYLIVLPFVLFVVWSGLSILWSSSWRNAVHHTLLWACYFVFYALFRRGIAEKKTLSRMLRIGGLVVFSITAACFLEYIGSPKPITYAFTARYYVYAEALITLLPVFLAISLKAETKWHSLSSILVVFIWGLVLLTQSRTMLIAGILGLLLFVILTYAKLGFFSTPRRWIGLFGALILITIFSQLPFVAGQTTTTLERLTGNEEYSVLSARSRVLLWGMAVEGFKERPLTGIGADNYFSGYRSLREEYSAKDPQNPILEINEDLIPERAHNEYLQMLCELGVVGASLFAWLIFGVGYFSFSSLRQGNSLLGVAAIAGMAGFLVSSGSSSYSFRFPANGICFFFLLAVAIGGQKQSETSETVNRSAGADRVLSSQWVIVIGILISLATMAFSVVRSISTFHLANSLNTSDPVAYESEIRKAISIDDSEPMFRFYYGQQLYLSGREQEAIPQLGMAIDNGFANSTTFFNLAGAQMRSGRTEDANRTFEEALKVFPRSVFMRTAYVHFLKTQQQRAEAAVEYAKAESVNPKQARSWMLAHDEGLERLTQVARVDSDFAPTMDLRPADAPLALVNFQRRANVGQ